MGRTSTADAATSQEKPVRKRKARPKTLSAKRLSPKEAAFARRLNQDETLFEEKPQTRGECRHGLRPCPYVGCRHHLFLDVNQETGSIKLNFPDKNVWELEETCSLDVANRGGITLEDVGITMNLTRERVRQVEAAGLDKIREMGGLEMLLELLK